jgi:hypothetical protein
MLVVSIQFEEGSGMNILLIAVVAMFMINGIYALVRAEYAAAAMWIALGAVFIVTLDNRDSAVAQSNELRRGSIKVISAVIALTIAVTLLGYQVVKDFTAKNSSDPGSKKENINTKRQ